MDSSRKPRDLISILKARLAGRTKFARRLRELEAKHLREGLSPAEVLELEEACRHPNKDEWDEGGDY